MKTAFKISLILVALASSLVSAQVIKPTYQTSTLTIPPSFLIDGLFFDPPFFSYNASTNTLNELQVTECDGEFFITENLLVWCLGADFQTNTFTVYQLSNDLSQSIGSWVIPGVVGKQGEVTYDYFGNYINFFFGNLYIAFDTYSLEFVCPIHKKQITGYGWFLNSSVVTVAVDGDNSEIIFNPCSGGEPIVTIGKNQGEEGPIYGMNQSTVFLRALLGENNRYYYSSGTFDITGRFHFGQSYFEASGEPLNDTHIALVNPNGVGLYVIAPNLSFVQVQNYPLDVNSTLLSVSTIRGSSMVIVYFEDAQFLYDFNSNEIVRVFSDIPPIFFNNGSVVNLTVHGYFIENPGQPINFIKNQVLTFYVNGSDPTKVYGLYAKNNNNSNSDSCTLLSIDGTNNIIKDTVFPNCPVQGEAFIHDVTFDSTGNLVLSYTDAQQTLTIVTSTQALGPFSNVKGISPLSISVNLKAQTASYAGFNYTNDREFLAGTFSLSTGKSINSGNLTVGILNNFILKLTENYYLITSTFENETTTLFVWNTSSLSQVNPVHFEHYCNSTGLVPLGISEFNPSIYSAVVCQNGYQQYTIVSPSGKVSVVSNSAVDLLEIEAVDNTTFVVYAEDLQFETLSYFNLVIE